MSTYVPEGLSSAWGGNPSLQGAAETAVASEASTLGIPVPLAEAVAYQESGDNPYAVGDSGTSFGLGQLHRGGELGSLSPTQAFDPATNASVFESTLASVYRQNPGADPGTIAAEAQRPANPAAYAASIDQLLAGGTVPTPSGASTSASGSGGSVQTSSWWNPFSWLGSLQSSIGKDLASIGVRLVGAGGGLALIVLGVVKATGTEDKLKAAAPMLAEAAPLAAA